MAVSKELRRRSRPERNRKRELTREFQPDAEQDSEQDTGACACSPRATTNAMARSSSWLRLTDQWLRPRDRARRAAAPCSCTDGAPRASETTSRSIQRIPSRQAPVPKALAIASLAAKRAARDSTRSRQWPSSASVYRRFRNLLRAGGLPSYREMALRMRSISTISTPVCRIILQWDCLLPDSDCIVTCFRRAFDLWRSLGSVCDYGGSRGSSRSS